MQITVIPEAPEPVTGFPGRLVYLDTTPDTKPTGECPCGRPLYNQAPACSYECWLEAQ